MSVKTKIPTPNGLGYAPVAQSRRMGSFTQPSSPSSGPCCVGVGGWVGGSVGEKKRGWREWKRGPTISV